MQKHAVKPEVTSTSAYAAKQTEKGEGLWKFPASDTTTFHQTASNCRAEASARRTGLHRRTLAGRGNGLDSTLDNEGSRHPINQACAWGR